MVLLSVLVGFGGFLYWLTLPHKKCPNCKTRNLQFLGADPASAYYKCSSCKKEFRF